MNFEHIKDLVYSRKSTYPAQFSGAKIADTVVWELLDLVRWAPTHRLTEPWKFQVYSDSALDRIVELHRSYYLATTEVSQRNPKKLEKYDTVKNKVSHLVAIVLDRDEMQRVPEWEEVAALAMGVQNLYLGMEALGVCGYWSTGNGTGKKPMEEKLNLGPNESLMGWFYLGIPTEGLQSNRLRKPIEDKVDWFSE